ASSFGNFLRSFRCQRLSAMWMTELAMKTSTAESAIGISNDSTETIGLPPSRLIVDDSELRGEGEEIVRHCQEIDEAETGREQALSAEGAQVRCSLARLDLSATRDEAILAAGDGSCVARRIRCEQRQVVDHVVTVFRW